MVDMSLGSDRSIASLMLQSMLLGHKVSLMAFWRRLCPLPKRKSACRTFAQFSARPLLRGARHSPHQRQSSEGVLASLAFSGFINLSPIVSARVPNCRTPPSCRPMDGRYAESFPSLLRTAKNVSLRNTVAALTHSRGDSPQRQSRGTKLKIYDVDAIASTLPRLKPVHIGESA